MKELKRAYERTNQSLHTKTNTRIVHLVEALQHINLAFVAIELTKSTYLVCNRVIHNDASYLILGLKQLDSKYD